MWIQCTGQVKTSSLKVDSFIDISDSEAVFYAKEHIAADGLRKDTANYLRAINDYKMAIGDYKSAMKVDSGQISLLSETNVMRCKQVSKLTQSNTRLKRLSAVSLGGFVVSVSWVIILWKLK